MYLLKTKIERLEKILENEIPINLLLIANNDSDIVLIKKTLSESEITINLSTTETQSHTIQLLENNTFDVIVSEYYLQNFTSVEILESINPKYPHLPFIVLSNGIGEEKVLQVLSKGAASVLFKNNLQTLIPTILKTLDDNLIKLKKAVKRKNLELVNVLLEENIRQRTNLLEKKDHELIEIVEKFNSIISSIDDIVYSVDAKTEEFIFLSPVFERLTGYTLEDIENAGGRKSFLKTITNDHSNSQNILFDNMKNGTLVTDGEWEFEWLCKDGSKKVFQDKWKPFYSEGKLIRTDGIIRDITKQKYNQDIIRKNEERLNLIYLINQLTPFSEAEICKYALDESIRILDCKLGAIFFFSDSKLNSIFSYPIEISESEKFNKVVSDQLLKEYFLKYFTIKEPTTNKNVAATKTQYFDIANYIIVPIINYGEVIGIATCINKNSEISESDIIFFDTVIAEMWKIIVAKKTKLELNKLQSAVEHSPVSIVITDIKGNIEYVNKKFSNITGYTFNEAIGNNPRILKGGKTSTEEYYSLWNTIKSGKEWKGEFHNKKKNGDYFWEYASISPIKNNYDEIINFIAIKEDITEKKKLDEELENDRKELNIILETIGDSVIITDNDLNITKCNNSVIELLEYPKEEIIALSITELFTKLRIRTDHDPNSKKIETFNYQSIEQVIKYFSENEKSRFYFFAGTGLNKIVQINFAQHVSSKTKVEYIFVLKDLTETVKTEQKLLLGRKLESIGELAAGIAHEINTPLQYVGDNLRFLQNANVVLEDGFNILNSLFNKHGKENPIVNISDLGLNSDLIDDLGFMMEEIPKAVDQSLVGIERMSKIVRAMKDFSHPGANNMSYSDINHGINVTIDISRNKWKYAAEIETDLSSTLPLVYCCIDEINQVVLNMIVNSAHSIEEKVQKGIFEKGLITISTFHTDKQVTISIQDNGLGIPKENEEKIFDPFFTTKAVGRGTGQGLSISRDIIVKKHEGELTFESEMNVGTTFKIILPLKEEKHET